MTANIYRSAVGNEFDSHSMEADGRTMAEMFPGVDWDNTIAMSSGRMVSSDYIPKNDDIVCMRTYPSSLGAAVGVAAVAAVTYFVGDVITSAATGKHIHEHIADGIKSLLTPDASSASNTASGSVAQTIPTLKGAKNSSGYGQPIPLVLGESLLTPRWHGRPYTTIDGTDGENQYYHVMYVLGYSDIGVRDICLDNIKIATNSENVTNGMITLDSGRSKYDDNIQLEIRTGASELALYNQKVVQESLSVELMHPQGESALSVDRFSAANPDKIEIEFGLAGLYAYNGSGNMSNASVEIGISVSFDGGNTYVPFGPVTGSTSYRQQEHMTLSTITRAKNKGMRFVATRQLKYAEAVSCVNKGNGVAFIHIERYNPDSASTKVSDTVQLTAIRTWCFDRKATLDGNSIVKQIPVEHKKRDITTRLAMTINATDDLQGQLDALNMIVTSMCRTWNGSEWSPEKTPCANPAAVALMLMQSPMLGSKAVSDSRIDLAQYGRLYEFCENQTYTDSKGKETPVEFTCGTVLMSRKKMSEVIDMILSTCKAMRTLNGNKYSVLIDEPRTVPVTVLNNHNILADGRENNKSFEELPDGYKVKFVDKSNGYDDGEFYCMYDGKDYTSPDAVVENIEFPMVTDWRQAYKLARYELAKRKLRPEVWTVPVGLEGKLIEIGSLVSVQDDTLLVGIGDGGEIKEVIMSQDRSRALGIKTDSHFDVSDMTKTYGVKISHFTVEDGRVFDVRKCVFSASGYYDVLMFENPVLVSDGWLPAEGDIVSFGILGKETSDAICFGKRDDGNGNYVLTLIPYSEGVYTADSGEIPDYDSNVTGFVAPAGINELPPDYATRSELSDTVNSMSPIRWLGSFDTAPSSPQINNAYYNTITKTSYVWDGTFWQMMSRDGMSVSQITKMYLATDLNAGVTRDTPGFTSGVQTMTASKRYLWTYDVVTITSGDTSDTKYSDPVVSGVYGDKGDPGDKGRDGGYQDYQFAVGDFDMTDAQLRALTWHDAPPAVGEGQFLWMRTRWVEGGGE